MENLPGISEPTVTIQELAEILKVSGETIKRAIRKMYPGLMENGKTTYLSEKHVTEIKKEILLNNRLPNLHSTVSVSTKLERVELVQKAMTILLEDNFALQSQIEAIQPKAEAYDQFLSAGTNLTMEETAKVLGVGRNNLFKTLREKSILQASNLPYQNQMETGRFVVRPVTKIINGQNVLFETTLVTPKGVDWIQRMLLVGK